MLAVMCCGCLRLLGKEGELLGPKSEDGGAIDFSEIVLRFASLKETAASFPNKQECDRAALEHGWTVTDPDGRANHRCPDCRLSKPETERSGAYIDWDAI